MSSVPLKISGDKKVILPALKTLSEVFKLRFWNSDENKAGLHLVLHCLAPIYINVKEANFAGRLNTLDGLNTGSIQVAVVFVVFCT